MKRFASLGETLHTLLGVATVLSLTGAPAQARTRASVARGLEAATLSGQVVDDSGDGIAGARVFLVELDRAVLTDQGGAFGFPNVSEGTYALEVRRTGYRTRVVTVAVPTASPVMVTLETAAIPLEPLNVTVARGPLAPANSPLPVGVLGSEDLDREVSVSLAYTLSRLPGVRNLSTGQEIGKPVIRGLAGARVLVVSQGLRLEDYAWSDEDGPAVDAAMVDRIEVIRGPASVLYGADAVGGVVNVVPAPLPDAAGGAGFKRFSAEAHFAANNRESGAVVRGEGASGAWGWRATATGRLAEALHTPAGELENTGFGAVNAEAALVRRGDWGSFTTRLVHNGGEFKLLEEDEPVLPPGAEEEGGPERKLMDDRLQLMGNFPVGDQRLETRVQAQRHNIIEMEDDPAALALGQFVEVEIFNLTLSTLLGEALLHHSLSSGTSGTIGVTGEAQTSSTAGVIPVIPGADQQKGGIFLLERGDFGRITLLGGGRADLAGVSADGKRTRAFSALTWTAGAAAHVTDDVSLTGNVGSAWRAPTLFELYAAGPRLGEARYELGDPNLDEEHSINLDAGLRLEGDRVRGHVAAYRNEFDGFLYIQPTGTVINTYDVYVYRQADARLEGIEASAEVEPASWLSLSGRGDYVRGTNRTADEPLPLMPPRRLTFGAEVHGPWPSTDDLGFFGAEVDNVAEPTRLNALDTPVGGYTLLNLSAGLRTVWMGRETGVDLRVRNALNASYKDFLSRYKAFALNPGRDIILRLRMSF